jgi:3-deoxy-D-manno-octulosonic-acid transferase
MIFLYNVGVRLAAFFVGLASLFNEKAKLFNAGRKDVFAAMKTELAGNKNPVVWIHCASLGEFEQGRPVMEEIKRSFPSIKILLTFFSPSGYEVRKQYQYADFIFYLPWDTAKNAQTFITITKPTLAIFVKYEFWFHYAALLKKNNIPLISISAIFRPSQIFFKSYAGFYKSILKNFSMFFVQNTESKTLLKSIGIENVVVAGDTRFDRVYKIISDSTPIAIAERFKNNEKTMVIGSCWPEDLDVLLPFINQQRSKFIIAPHEISNEFLSTIEKSVQGKCIRYSAAENKPVEEYTVLLIDNIGMLSRLYRYGEFAYIGGAFGKGLHNILEAACYGVPIFFGNKNYEKFQEAIDLINQGGAFVVKDYSDLKEKYEMLNEPENFLLACDVTRSYVEQNLGATDKVLSYCQKVLSEAKQ